MIGERETPEELRGQTWFWNSSYVTIGIKWVKITDLTVHNTSALIIFSFEPVKVKLKLETVEFSIEPLVECLNQLGILEELFCHILGVLIGTVQV